MAHVMLHVGLCAAIQRVHSQTTVAMRVRLTDRAGRKQVDRTFRIEPDYGTQALVEFDSQFGAYRLDVDAPKYGCSTSDYLFFIAGHSRSVTETLGTTPPTPQVPVLLSGTAPQSFLYVHPTYVLFDKSAMACNKPVANPLPTHVTVENDQDAYYATLYNDDPMRAPGSQLLALRLQTPTHQYHYVRIPLPFPMQTGNWPAVVTLNIDDGMVDELATEPIDTLLCPKMWQTSAG
ncbi:MAG TPA: hypothetical protein VNG31_05160 [Candidatus Baltobacteraceae bacterium]|nr:hypothetical protein [Candidatus Baltobacteraceae bacterium]